MVVSKRLWLKTAIGLGVLACYILGVQQIITDRSRRPLQIKDDVPAADRVLISVTVTNVNPAARQLTAELRFRLVGQIAQDEVTPRSRLRLLLNSIGGQQEFDFPEGKRISRIEATFPLDGELNRYPLDRYVATLRLLVTTPRKTDQPRVPQISHHPPEEATQPDDLYVGETKLQSNAPIPLSISVLASIPGLRFSGEVSRNDDSQAAVVALSMRRSANLIRVSFAVMVVMMGLAVGVLAMALKMTTQKKFDLIPLSWSIMLIFGLPALRNIQPGVPAVGTLGDYFSFVWAELFVAASAIIVICTWLFRSESD